jgi:hypothetical protein
MLFVRLASIIQEKFLGGRRTSAEQRFWRNVVRFSAKHTKAEFTFSDL